MSDPFEPDWTSPPGDTLTELLELRGWTQSLLARELGYSLKHINLVMHGKATIGVDLALALERLDFGTAEFWMAREANYRISLARLEQP